MLADFIISVKVMDLAVAAQQYFTTRGKPAHRGGAGKPKVRPGSRELVCRHIDCDIALEQRKAQGREDTAHSV